MGRNIDELMRKFKATCTLQNILKRAALQVEG